MTGRLARRSLARLTLATALAVVAGLSGVASGPGLRTVESVAAAHDTSLSPGAREAVGWLAAGSEAARVTGHRGPAAFATTPSFDPRAVSHLLPASPSAAAWPLALRVAWIGPRVAHASQSLARAAGHPAGRAPPASAGS